MINSRPVVRVDKKTGEVLERFKSIYSAQRSEMGQLCVRQQCNNKTLGNKRYFYRYEEDYDPSENWEGKSRRPTWIIDGKTGLLIWARNRAAAADALGVSTQTLTDSTCRGYLIKGRYKVRLQRSLDEWRLLEERMKDEVSQG